MTIAGTIKKGEYYDSVALMIVARELSGINGVIDAAVVMGTQENKAILATSGLLTDQFKEAEDNDLLVAINADTSAIAAATLAKIDLYLKKLRTHEDTGETHRPPTLQGALKKLPDANLAMISVAGRYAADEAMNALRAGMHVMLFSDNVSVEEEVRLKQFARERDLLVMGPDCGTAIINGVPLAFANHVNPGPIGIVAAAGTGLQEVSCLISRQGSGISQAIGTGGRDVKNKVGGITFIQGLKALADDPATEIILLVSKPPDTAVLERIGAVTKEISKPVIAAFLGADPQILESNNIEAAATLADAAQMAVRRALKTQRSSDKIAESRNFEREVKAKLKGSQKYIRALYSGGTFCAETQIIFGKLKDVYANTPTGNSKQLTDANKSEKHTVVDLGEDEFTRGKPHPMIDYSTRNKRIIAEAGDPQTAVILLDLVIGYGANMDPLTDIVPILKQARAVAAENGCSIPVICSVTGTDLDPQGYSKVRKGLEECGAIVCQSNAAAARLALTAIAKH